MLRVKLSVAVTVGLLVTLMPFSAWADSATPVPIAGLANVRSITADGYVLLGNATVQKIDQSGNVAVVPGARGVAKIVDETATYGLRTDGTVLAWGTGEFGALGNGQTHDSAKAVRVKGLTRITQIAAYGSTAYALRRDGTVWAWGYGAQGQLGTGKRKNSNVPVRVKGLSKVTAVYASGGAYGEEVTAYAVRSDGRVFAWGRGSDGQVGVASRKDQLIPVIIRGFTNVKFITGGWGATFALKNDGSVWAWGHSNGALGDGTITDRTRPHRVPGVTDAIAVDGGLNTGYALLANGEIWAWGWNAAGQLGDGTNIDRPTPARVGGLPAMATLDVGPYEVSAIASDGTAWFWGDSGPDFTGFLPSSTTAISLGLSSAVTALAGPWALAIDGTVWRWQAASST